MRSGRLRDKIQIQHKTQTTSASGQVVYAWVSVFETWADIQAVKQTQDVRADKSIGPATHIIRMRYAPVDFKSRIIELSTKPATMIFSFEYNPTVTQMLTSQNGLGDFSPLNFNGHEVTNWYIGQQYTREDGSVRIHAIGVSDDGFAIDAYFVPDESGYELNDYGLMTSEFATTGSQSLGTFRITTPAFQSFSLSPASRIFMVSGVTDPDGKEADLIVEAIESNE